MTKFKTKMCSFVATIAMLIFVLPITTVYAQTTTLSDALLKTNMANSIESNGKLNLTFKAEGLSAQDEQDFGGMSELLNNSQISFNTKVSGNSTGTISRQYAKISALVGGSPYDGELWSDINLTGKTPVVKEIVKSPQLFEMMFGPEYTNKYMLLDLAKLTDMQAEQGSMDFGKIMSENKELQQQIVTIIEKYSSQLNSNNSFISKVGNEYKVKINDAKFKDIIRDTVGITSKDKEIQDLINNLIITQLKNSGASTEEINNTKVEIRQLFTTLDSQDFLDNFNKIMDKLQDVKILGDKGIDITYITDENGYITSTKGVIELALDVAKLDKVFGETASDSIPTGKYTIGINFEINNSNINGKVNIALPILTKANSFSYDNMFGDPNEQPTEIITKVIKNVKSTNNSNKAGQPVVVAHTVTGGELPKTSTHLYELLLLGGVLTLIGALGLKSRKHYE